MAERFAQAADILGGKVREALFRTPPEIRKKVLEIRLRSDAPVMLTTTEGMRFLWPNGRTGCLYDTAVLTMNQKEMDDRFLHLCGYAVHSHMSEIRQGFLSLEGGHRVGICGKAVTDAEGGLLTLSTVTGINLRIARTVPDAARVLCTELFASGLQSVILAGAPLSGKTTILRDLAVRLSEGLCGRYYRVCVMDARQEFGALPFCDVLSGYDKAEGISVALRAMAPEMLICDEVTSCAEVDALQNGFSSGVECAVSIHASTVDQLRHRKPFRMLLETGQFSHVVLLKKDALCQIEEIISAEELL